MVSDLLAGLLVGVAARLVMRLIAMVIGQPAVFTVSGTIGVFLVSAIPAVLIGLLFIVVSKWLPGPLVVKGLIFGATLLLVLVCRF